MNFRKTSELDARKQRLTEAILKYDLMLGSQVPQPKYLYFMEQERVIEHSNGSTTYRRKWFYLDAICQKDHSHIPLLDEEDLIKQKVRKTRNYKLYNKMHENSGITLESEGLQYLGYKKN